MEALETLSPPEHTFKISSKKSLALLVQKMTPVLPLLLPKKLEMKTPELKQNWEHVPLDKL